MFTNLPKDETTLFHPITFFDQGTYFFETRHRLDGDAIFRQYPTDWPDEGNATDWIHPNHTGAQDTSWCSPSTTMPSSRTLVLDPLNPRIPLPAEIEKTLANSGDNEGTDYLLHCPGVEEGSWHMLAFISPHDLDYLRRITGDLPDRPEGVDEEEWLLRHAFSDEHARKNSLLATTLARLPLLFARAEEPGCICFRTAGILRNPCNNTHWLVAVVDACGDDER